MNNVVSADKVLVLGQFEHFEKQLANVAWSFMFKDCVALCKVSDIHHVWCLSKTYWVAYCALKLLVNLFSNLHALDRHNWCEYTEYSFCYYIRNLCAEDFNSKRMPSYHIVNASYLQEDFLDFPAFKWVKFDRLIIFKFVLWFGRDFILSKLFLRQPIFFK